MSDTDYLKLHACDGKRTRAALEYALFACPRPTEDDLSLSHVVFTVDRKVVACDGDRFQAGCLPPGPDFTYPFAATRDSADALLALCKAAAHVVGANGSFQVRFDSYPDGSPGFLAVVECAGEFWPWHLERAEHLFHVPPRWTPPVAEDATPIASPPSGLRSQHVNQATSIKDTVATWRMQAEAGPVRIDLRAYDRETDEHVIVGTAVLLPAGVRAILVDDEQREMFGSPPPEPHGQSVLSMKLEDSRRGESGKGDSASDLKETIAGLKKRGLTNAAEDLEYAMAHKEPRGMAIARAQLALREGVDIPKRCYPASTSDHMDEAIDALRPRKGSGIESVTFEVPGAPPVTLTAEGGEAERASAKAGIRKAVEKLADRGGKGGARPKAAKKGGRPAAKKGGGGRGKPKGRGRRS